jgi:hypothetical protein
VDAPLPSAGLELLADAKDAPNVQLRYRIIARHYRELADREEQADNARMADRIKQLRRQRQQAAALPADSGHPVLAYSG